MWVPFWHSHSSLCLASCLPFIRAFSPAPGTFLGEGCYSLRLETLRSMSQCPSSGWKRISRHGVVQKGVGLLRTESRDNEGAASTHRGPTPQQTRGCCAGLAANSYSLKTENSCRKAGTKWLVGASLGAQMLQTACDAEDVGLIPGAGRSHGGGHGTPQCSCLKNPMDGGARRAAVHGVTEESDTTERQTLQSDIGWPPGWAFLSRLRSGGQLVIPRGGFWQLWQRGSARFGGGLRSGLRFCGLGARLRSRVKGDGWPQDAGAPASVGSGTQVPKSLVGFSGF